MVDLVLTDLHFTDDFLDYYKKSLCDKYLTTFYLENSVNRIIILGDLTEKKDNHSSKLVNYVVEFISLLTTLSHKVVILKGNHDYIDSDKPYFKFLQYIPNVCYICDIPKNNDKYIHEKELFLPHTKTPIEDWKDIDFNKYDRIFMHQTITGAKASNDFALKGGLPSDYFSTFKGKVYSGDIHTPQIINNVTYIGSPYPIYFNDTFIGRYLILEGDEEKFIELPNIKKEYVEIFSDILEKGKIKTYLDKYVKDDQIKLRVNLYPSEYHLYGKIKKEVLEYCNKKKILLINSEMKSLSKEKEKIIKTTIQKKENTKNDIIEEYGKRNKIDTFSLAVGKDIIREYTNGSIIVN